MNLTLRRATSGQYVSAFDLHRKAFPQVKLCRGCFVGHPGALAQLHDQQSWALLSWLTCPVHAACPIPAGRSIRLRGRLRLTLIGIHQSHRCPCPPDRYPRSSQYDPRWLLDPDMGPNPLWLLEDLAQDLDLHSGMKVLDLGSGRGATSVFLARE